MHVSWKRLRSWMPFPKIATRFQATAFTNQCNTPAPFSNAFKHLASESNARALLMKASRKPNTHWKEEMICPTTALRNASRLSLLTRLSSVWRESLSFQRQDSAIPMNTSEKLREEHFREEVIVFQTTASRNTCNGLQSIWECFQVRETALAS